MRDKIIIFSIAFLIILVLGFIAHVQYFKTRKNVIDLYSEKQILLANQAALTLESFIKERIKAVEVLADFPASRNLEKKTFLTEYSRTYEKVKGFEFIVFINPNGEAIAGVPENFPCPATQPPEVRNSFFKSMIKAKEQRKTIVFSKNVLINDKVLLCLISPVISYQDEFRGAILGVLDVEECVTTALKPILTNVQDYAWVLNGQGYLLYHPKHEDMRMKNIFVNQQACNACHQRFAIERDMLNKDEGAGVKVNLKTPKQLIGYASIYLENTHWVVAVSSPFTRAATSIRNHFQNFLLLILFMTATVIIGATLISRINTKHVTAKKEIENLKIRTALIEEKKAAESRYRILVEQSPDPIFLCTLKEILMVNHSFEKLFQYKMPEVCHSDFTILNLINPDYHEKFKKEIASLIKGKKQISTISLKMKNKSGDLLEVEISLSRFQFGDELAYQGVVHDMTRTKKLEREREQKKHLAMIGEMAARIAHEIKNPLASIQTGIQLLESQIKENNGQKKYFERLRWEIQRVDSILKGLLTFAREENYNFRLVSIEQFIRRFEDIIKPTVEKQNLTLDVNLEKDLPQVNMDEQKIQQVLWNILLNAIQASKPGDKIYIHVFPNGNGINLEIHDQGEGISKQHLNKIFQPFFSTRSQGSGLGLSVSKNIIDRHNGLLKIDSAPGQGTVVTIYLTSESSIS